MLKPVKIVIQYVMYRFQATNPMNQNCLHTMMLCLLPLNDSGSGFLRSSSSNSSSSSMTSTSSSSISSAERDHTWAAFASTLGGATENIIIFKATIKYGHFMFHFTIFSPTIKLNIYVKEMSIIQFSTVYLTLYVLGHMSYINASGDTAIIYLPY